MTVDELLDRISGAELHDWMVYERAYGPLGPARGDVLAAQVVAAVVNLWRDPKKSRPVRLEDARLRWPGDPEREVDVEDQAVIVQQMAAQFGGEISIGDAG